MKKEIVSNAAPQAIGPYSQGVRYCHLVFTSGQIPVNPATGEIPQGIKAQAEQALTNLKAVIEDAGSGMEKVLKVTVFLKNIDDFAVVNEIYGKYFPKPYPARSCIEVSKLPKDVLLEIEAVSAV
ncbi:MAG: RidA family protein [Deferribacterales bacterium]|nr:RidA family protein [Deferribacterales bacterium]